MKKKFWKLEYSVTLVVVFAVILLLIPSQIIASKEAYYITKWNDTYNKMEYLFNAMIAQADTKILSGLNKVNSDEQKSNIMQYLVKPYLRLDESKQISHYSTYYMNGTKVKKTDNVYFTELYSSDNMVIGIKGLADNGAYAPAFLMMFDVNGKKRPNVWGKDIYAINIYKDGKISPIGTGWDIDKIKQDCSSYGLGLSCSHYYRIGGEFNE